MKRLNLSDHFGTGSVWVEFLAGRLGAPECWPDRCDVKKTPTQEEHNQPARRAPGTFLLPATDTA